MKKRKKQGEKEPNLERWLVSYADFITLLFAVFVTLYAMGQVDKKKTDEVIHSLQHAFGIAVMAQQGGGEPFANAGNFMPVPLLSPEGLTVAKRQKKAVAEINDLLTIKGQLDKGMKGLEKNSGTDINRRGLVINLQVADLFAPGDAVLLPQAYPLLSQIGKVLVKYANPIAIEGFTDNQDIHSARFASNWELSCARALSVLHFLLDKEKFDPAQLAATGYGPNHPIADNNTEAGRNLNRRVEIVVQADGTQDQDIW